MDEQEIPVNEFIALSVIESYIEKYPEDTYKFIEHIREPSELDKNQPRRRLYRESSNIDQNDFQQVMTEYNTPPNIPIESHEEGCLFCKKSWLDTHHIMPMTTLLCGHRYHTLCFCMAQYDNDTQRCIVEDCPIDTFTYVRRIHRANRKTATNSLEDILIDSYKNRPDFKSDIQGLKKCISGVSSAHTKVLGLIKQGRDHILHKHLCSIKHIQSDMNDSVKLIKTGEEICSYKKSVSKFRKQASNIFKKYHVSFRELVQRKIIKVPWRIRYRLERHETAINYYKFGIRIYPGKNTWRDPLV